MIKLLGHPPHQSLIASFLYALLQSLHPVDYQFFRAGQVDPDEFISVAPVAVPGRDDQTSLFS